MNTSDPPSSAPVAATLDRMRAEGRPTTKVEYLRAMFHPYSPDFPLAAEIAAEVPTDLPGTLPDSLIAYLRATPEED